jgi:hypothetical protein
MRTVGLAHVLLGVPVNEECNSQHVAVSRLVANTLACFALNPRSERATPLIRSVVPALGCTGYLMSRMVAVLIGCNVAVARGSAASMSEATIRAITWGPIKSVTGAIDLDVTECKFFSIIVIPKESVPTTQCTCRVWISQTLCLALVWICIAILLMQNWLGR